MNSSSSSSSYRQHQHQHQQQQIISSSNLKDQGVHKPDDLDSFEMSPEPPNEPTITYDHHQEEGGGEGDTIIDEDDGLLLDEDELLPRSHSASPAQGATSGGSLSATSITTASTTGSAPGRNGSIPAPLMAGYSKRQAHIVSEQKRRQNINDGFEELRRIIPSCQSSPDSKAVILRKAANYINQLVNEVTRLKYIIANSGGAVGGGGGGVHHQQQQAMRHPIYHQNQQSQYASLHPPQQPSMPMPQHYLHQQQQPHYQQPQQQQQQPRHIPQNYYQHPVPVPPPPMSMSTNAVGYHSGGMQPSPNPYYAQSHLNQFQPPQQSYPPANPEMLMQQSQMMPSQYQSYNPQPPPPPQQSVPQYGGDYGSSNQHQQFQRSNSSQFSNSSGKFVLPSISNLTGRAPPPATLTLPSSSSNPATTALPNLMRANPPPLPPPPPTPPEPNDDYISSATSLSMLRGPGATGKTGLRSPMGSEASSDGGVVGGIDTTKHPYSDNRGKRRAVAAATDRAPTPTNNNVKDADGNLY